MAPKRKTLKDYEEMAHLSGECLIVPVKTGNISRKIYKMRHGEIESSEIWIHHTCFNKQCILDSHMVIGPKPKRVSKISKSKDSYHTKENKGNGGYWKFYIKTTEDEFFLAAFKRMHDRVRDGKVETISWPRKIEGFEQFRKEIGEIPSGMIKPSIGRIDHSQGYIPGNVVWQEYSINSKLRKGTHHESDAYPLR